MFERFGFTLCDLGAKERQMHGKVGIVVRDGHIHVADSHRHADLLAAFAHKGFGKRFAAFRLAADEFP